MQFVWASGKIKCGDEKDHRIHHWTCTLITEPPSSRAQSCCLNLQRWRFTPWFLWSGGAAVAVVEQNWNSVQVSDKGRFSRNEYSRQQRLPGIKKEKEINRVCCNSCCLGEPGSALTQFHLHTWRSLAVRQRAVAAGIVHLLVIYWEKEVCFCAFDPSPVQQTTLLLLIASINYFFPVYVDSEGSVLPHKLLF